MIGETWVEYKDINKSQKIVFHHITLTRKLVLRNITLKMDHHTGGKWFIHSPKHCKKNQ